MAYRYDNRSHDWVLEKTVQEFYSSDGKIVHKNPNQQKNADIDGFYPDIIVCDKNGNVKTIDEIETEESITDSETEQWKNFSRLDVGHFSLTVPEEKVNELLQLLAKHSISVSSVWAYTIGLNNAISFTKVRG
jgi:hypothetical protein